MINFLKEPFTAQQYSFIIRNKNEVLKLTYAGRNLKRVWMNSSEEVLGQKKQKIPIVYYLQDHLETIKKEKPEQSTLDITKRNSPRRLHKRKTNVNRRVRKDKAK